MQLKLQLPGVVLEPAPTVWGQLDPEAQKAVVQALAVTTVKVIEQEKAGQRNKSGEARDDRQN